MQTFDSSSQPTQKKRFKASINKPKYTSFLHSGLFKCNFMIVLVFILRLRNRMKWKYVFFILGLKKNEKRNMNSKAE